MARGSGHGEIGEVMFEDVLEELLPDEWEVGSYGDSLVCPHGNEIELDGMCPDGCVSPLRTMGMI